MFYQFSFPEAEFLIAPVADVPGINVTRENWYKTDAGFTRVQGEMARLGTQFGPEFEGLKNSFL